MQPIDEPLIRDALSRPAPFKPPDALPAMLPAAVLVPIRCGNPSLVTLVERADHLAEHGGELGFPGGKPEPTDASLDAAALREAEEEVGITAEQVTLLGALAPVPVVTGRYLIHPFVGLLRTDVTPRSTSGEIARVHQLALEPFLRGEVQIEAVLTKWRGRDFPLPHFRVAGRVLYGASAVIFAELLVRIADALGVTLRPPALTADLPWKGRYGD